MHPSAKNKYKTYCHASVRFLEISTTKTNDGKIVGELCGRYGEIGPWVSAGLA